MNATKSFDQAKAEAFADKMIGLLNDASLSLMISLGHRTGLFDKMTNLPTRQIWMNATSANGSARWLRAELLITIRLTKFTPSRTCNISDARSENRQYDVFAQYISLMGNVEDKIVECFYNDGVPYSEYPRFQQLMAEESNNNIGGIWLIRFCLWNLHWLKICGAESKF